MIEKLLQLLPFTGVTVPVVSLQQVIAELDRLGNVRPPDFRRRLFFRMMAGCGHFAPETVDWPYMESILPKFDGHEPSSFPFQ